MTFLHPWLAGVGAAALALPIAIHILTRPRPVRMPLSTLRFVRQAIEQKAARHRLRDFLVLLLRVLAVGLLAWAFARPMLGAKPIIDPSASGNAIRVIILDDSMSIGAVSNASTALDRAKSAAGQYLREQPGLRADVIIAGAQANAVFDQASTNLGALRDAVSAANPLPQSMDAQAALNAAGKILADGAGRSPNIRTELIVISDFQRSTWASADFSPIPRDTKIQLRSVAASPQPDNLAILSVTARGRSEAGRQVRLEAEIGNFSQTPRDVQVEVDLGQSVYYLHGLCPPNGKTTLTAMATLPSAAGWITGHAKLIGVSDALAADNVRPLAIQVRPLPVYGLLTRESSKPHPSSSHFLERALVPDKPEPGQPGETVVRIDPRNLDHYSLDSASLLVLDHPGQLSDQTINLLATLVRRGRGMLYIAAEPADAVNLKKFSDVLGSDLKMPVEFVPPDPSQPRHDLFLLDWTKDQPPFDQLGDTMNAVAGRLRFNRGLASHRQQGGLIDDVLATYSDGSAFLVVTPCGAGALAVINADLPVSNLPASPLFVPLIDELCGRLLAIGDSPDAVPCGQPLATYLPAEAGAAAGLTITEPPEAGDDLGTITDESTGVFWRAPAAGPTGVYQVQRSGKTVFALATAPPADESDLQTIDPQTLTTRLAAGRRVQYETADNLPARDQAWAWLLVACCACLILELAVLKIFRT